MSSKLYKTYFFQLIMVESDLTDLARKPPDFSKSSVENISRRKCAVTFIFAPNVHVIEVHTLCLFGANSGKPWHNYE